METGSEQDLMAAVTDVGPIRYCAKGCEHVIVCHICCKHFPFSVVVDAAPLTFQFYSGGIYDDSNCRTNSLNHAMLLVGYGTDADTGFKYWILKNRLVYFQFLYKTKPKLATFLFSWGSDWGMDGYMYLSRDNNNLCGIATAASYPLLEQI